MVRSIALWEPQERTLLFSCSYDQSVRVWDLSNAEPCLRATINNKKRNIKLMATKNFLFVSTESNYLLRYELDLGCPSIIKEKPGNHSLLKYTTYFDSSFDVLKEKFVFGNPTQSVQLFAMENLLFSKIKAIANFDSEIKTIRVGKRCKYVAAGTQKSKVFLFNKYSSKRLFCVQNVFKSTINAIRFYDNEKKFVAGCWGKTIAFFRVWPTLEVIHTSSFSDCVFTVEVSTDSKYFCVAGWTNQIKVFSTHDELEE